MSKSTFDTKRLTGFSFLPEDLVIIGLDTDDKASDVPRHECFDKRAFDAPSEGLILSIRAKGVLTAITVKKGAKTEKWPKGQPEVVNGRGRVKAARVANKLLIKEGDGNALIEVPAMVVGGDEEFIGGVVVATNEVVRPDTLLGKVEKLQVMLLRNPDKKKAAVEFNVTPTTIANWVKISHLPMAVKKLVEDGVIATSVGAKLHGLEKEAMMAEVEKIKTEHKKTGKRVTTGKVDGNRAGKTGGKTNKKPTKAKLQEQLDKLEENNDAYSRGVKAALDYAIGTGTLKALTSK